MTIFYLSLQKFTIMKLNKIKPNPDNPRIIRDEKFRKLVKSINDFPEMMSKRPIVVDEDGMILGGNMRWRALQEIYGKNGEIPDEWVSVAEGWSEEKKREFVIKDNSQFGEYDWDMLANEWDAADLSDWGVDFPQDWAGTTPTEEEREASEDDFDETKDEVPTICKDGDIWQLGSHRLMCGDSTDPGSVALLMNGEKADIAFASPPYNAGFGKNLTKDNGRSKYTNGDNDNHSTEYYHEFLSKYIDNASNHSLYNFVNIQFLANNKTALMQTVFDKLNRLADIIIWDKGRSQPAAAENVLNSEFEFVFVFSEKANRNIGTIPFHGTLKNIVHISPGRNEFAEQHNAVFPIELPAHFIQHFAKESVLDLFGGSGTTLIAAEQLGRRCFMMELDPHYCDIIIARFEKLTGQKATKITNVGQPIEKLNG